MDLIPTPDQVVSAASSLAHKIVYGGVADLAPAPGSAPFRAPAARS